MSDVRSPAGAPESLSERLFWFITAFATLALGGFLYFGYLMFFPHPHVDARVAAAPAPTPTVKPAEVKAVEVPVAAPQPEPPKEVKETKPEVAEAAKAPVAPAPVEEKPAAAITREADAAPAAEMTPPPKKDEPEVNPYMVPNNKPFLSHEMFDKRPPTPVKPAGAAPAPAAKPKVATATPAKPAEPPRTLTAAPVRAGESTAVSDAASLPVVRGKIYVLKDGRRIPTVSTVDLGDSYGVKDLNSSYITILKADVSQVVNR